MNLLRILPKGLIAFSFVLVSVQSGFGQVTSNLANWKQSEKFSANALRPYVYSTRLTPNFLKDSDQFWYMWREATGKRFMFVDPSKKVKEPLFDHVKLAAQLSELHKKPYDSTTLPFDTVTMTESDKFFINLESKWYLYDRDKQVLSKSEKGPEQPKTEPSDYKTKSPDKKAYVYSLSYNLYVTEGDDDKNALQISMDGEKDFGFGGGFFDQNTEDPAPRKSRVNATWSEDSKRFFVTRFDSRKVKELFLVNNLAEPRPTLMKYRYAMPGEANVPQQELWVYTRDTKSFRKLKVEKFKDQLLINVHFPNNSDKVRFVRRDRLQRNAELCEYDLRTDEIKVLLTESVENAFLELRPVKYVKPGGDFLWFSERTGWGHYYRYDNNGKLLNAVSSGPWRADTLVEVDADKDLVWINGVGKDANENPYYTHVYRMKLDGSDFRTLTPGNANHAGTLSFSKKFVVDNHSRVDLAPASFVFNDKGERVLELEKMDLSRLEAAGWKMPETFAVKSDDGVVDIYGNMWKPMDFDPAKKYPIILNIYPGPQTESVSDTFSPFNTPQTLAQLGFIVIQIGNRGGSPQRSNAYHSYGYYNLRDYGLADKKAGVEQLAAKYPWIDVDKVGIFGHSGGGFMTAAALLLPPYNDFFKVGVSSAGNHDNNIYNSNWSEQHHGLKVSTSIFDTGTSSSSKASTPEEQWMIDVALNPLDAILYEQGQTKKDETKKEEVKKDDTKKDEVKKEETKVANVAFEIKVPTTWELAKNLNNKLLIVHGDMDNNVHPANSIRLVNALIKENKRFDFMLMPGQAHGFGPYQPYFQQMLMEYFSEHLLGDKYRSSAEMKKKGN